jgi:hypothetical protein
VPPHLPATDDDLYGDPARTPLTWKVRLGLLLVAVLLIGVFTVALWLDPYDYAGEPRREETHRQLGLPECTFKSLTGKVCPSCGMTTSFALLLRGDVISSVRANWVGTLLAVFLLLAVPWAVFSAFRKRLLLIQSLERVLTWAVAFFMTLLLVRWALILL